MRPLRGVAFCVVVACFGLFVAAFDSWVHTMAEVYFVVAFFAYSDVVCYEVFARLAGFLDCFIHADNSPLTIFHYMYKCNGVIIQHKYVIVNTLIGVKGNVVCIFNG